MLNSRVIREKTQRLEVIQGTSVFISHFSVLQTTPTQPVRSTCMLSRCESTDRPATGVRVWLQGSKLLRRSTIADATVLVALRLPTQEHRHLGFLARLAIADATVLVALRLPTQEHRHLGSGYR